ncbi:MAG: threonine synthase [Woeseia sp.]
MKFHSTRDGLAVTLDEALLKGLAADGGLFIPDVLPAFALEDFDRCTTITETAGVLLRPFFEESSLAGDLAGIVAETFSFPIPCVPLPAGNGHASLLELFHGPTAAFKDVGAGFLAACLSRLNRGQPDPLTILVATSGDTGGAVAAAFDGRTGMRVAVLFPDGRVTARQAHQLSCWGDNVLSLAVDGAFDDCQALVKAAFADPALSEAHRFSSANSINIGRLLPQSIYYGQASLEHFRATGKKPGFIIPTGNLGNGLACVMARDMGLPIGEIVLACNTNRLIADYLAGDSWTPRASIPTLASAMDVGNPSNMERLIAMHGDADALAGMLRAVAVSDAEIEEQIRLNDREFGLATCPHTATATHAWRALPAAERASTDWILVATAHAAKFEAIVEPLIGRTVPVPPELQKLLERPNHAERIQPTLAALGNALASRFRVDATPAGRDK